MNIFFLSIFLIGIFVIYAQSPVEQWTDIAATSKGAGVVGVYVDAFQTGMFGSVDYGQSWATTLNVLSFSTLFPDNWITNAVSNSTGQYQAIAVHNGNLFHTSNYWKGGWSYIPAWYAWNDIAISSTGQLFVGLIEGSGFYYSLDYGSTWHQLQAETYYLTTVSINYDGNWIITASEKNGGVYVVQGAVTSSPSYFKVTGMSSGNWTASAISSNGQVMLVVGSGLNIYASINYGNSFSAGTGVEAKAWTAAAMSSSGQHMAAAYKNGGIFYSTNFGSTWLSATGSSAVWYTGLACSSNGKIFYASVYNGNIQYSSNYGESWLSYPSVPTSNPTMAPGPDTRPFTYRNWSSIVTSQSGQYVVVAEGNGPIYRSTNYGASFSATSSGSGEWMSVASSGTGQYVAAGMNLGYIYLSNDFAASWSPAVQMYRMQWYSVAISENGQNITAAVYGGTIYFSCDFGASWNPVNPSYNQFWYSIAMSYDANYQAAVVFDSPIGEYIYVVNAVTHQWGITPFTSSEKTYVNSN